MKPENRRQASWEKQLSVVEEAFELRLEKFSTVEEVLAFGGKCLKNENLRESFTWFGFEAAEEQSLSWAAQVAFVHLQQEPLNWGTLTYPFYTRNRSNLGKEKNALFGIKGVLREPEP